jgi:GNAT superfamily N-acetyltransferase
VVFLVMGAAAFTTTGGATSVARRSSTRVVGLAAGSASPFARRRRKRSRKGCSPLYLYDCQNPPLRPQGVPSSLLDFGSERVLGLPEERDMPAVASLLANCFSMDVILSQKEGSWSAPEKAILSLPVNMYNSYMKGVSYYEVLFGTKCRIGQRFWKPTLDCPAAIGSSDVLFLSVMEGEEAVAAVELQLRIPDGALPGSLEGVVPSLGINRNVTTPPQPYLCNLCISERLRGLGLGKRLMWLCEHLVRETWGYDILYLHVDPADPVSSRLYYSLGYKKVALDKAESSPWMKAITGEPTVDLLVKTLTRGQLLVPPTA